MQKITSMTISVTGVLLLLVLISSLLVQPILAYDYDYGAASELYSTDWLMQTNELNNVTQAFSQIYDLFADQYIYVSGSPYQPVYGHLWNLKSLTYAWRVTNQMDDMGSNHDYATFFYYGHMDLHSLTGSPPDYNWPEWSYGFKEQALPDGPAPSAVWDDHHIYPHSGSGNFYFVFLWVCNDGNTAGSSSPIHGMPYCWTRQTLSTDGYGDPDIPGNPDNGDYCVISFENMSVPLCEETGTGNTYKNWLVFFYYYALNGYSISDALWWASWAVGWTGGWLDANNRLSNWYAYYFPGGGGKPPGYFNGRMRVYGDSDNYLPISEYW